MRENIIFKVLIFIIENDIIKSQKGEAKKYFFNCDKSSEDIMKKNQNNESNITKNISILEKFFIFLPFLFGLFFDYVLCFSGAILTVLLFLFRKNSKELNEISSQKNKYGGYIIHKNIYSLTVLVYLVFSFLTTFYGIDKGMSFVGFLRFIPVAIFLLIIMQLTNEERKRLLDTIPISGVLMVAISAPTYFIPFLKGTFYKADRLSGIFGYSNTFALFLLIGIIILAYSETKPTKKLVCIAVLSLGILLSGSRAVFVLSLLTCVFLLFRKAKGIKQRLLILSSIAGAFAISAIVALCTDNFQNIGRFLTISLSSSTFLGRLLYWKDALPVILKNPFGIGYMGYFFIQPEIQTGVYTAKFLHNDILQVFLDVGWIPAILLIICFVKSFIKVEERKKLLLFVIFAHAFFDFDFQYIYIVFIVLLLFDVDEGKPFVFRSDVFSKALAGIFAAFLVYCSISFGLCNFGKYSASLKMTPFYTEASIDAVTKETDGEYLLKLTDKLLKSNEHISQAWDVKAQISYLIKDYDSAVAFKKKSVELRKYDIANYNDYVTMLNFALEHYLKEDNTSKAKIYASEIVSVETSLVKLKGETSDIAFKIRDVPSFELNEQSQTLLKRAKALINQ